MPVPPVATLPGKIASTPFDHTPECSLNNKPSGLFELSTYTPTAVQLPGEEHDTDDRLAFGLLAALAGRTASTPCRHTPPLSVNSSPCVSPELSEYEPTAVQVPVEVH